MSDTDRLRDVTTELAGLYQDYGEELASELQAKASAIQNSADTSVTGRTQEAFVYAVGHSIDAVRILHRIKALEEETRNLRCLIEHDRALHVAAWPDDLHSVGT